MSVHTSRSITQVNFLPSFPIAVNDPMLWVQALFRHWKSRLQSPTFPVPRQMSAFLVRHPVLPASLCTLQMLSFAEDICPPGVSPVSITAKFSCWLKCMTGSVPRTGTEGRPNYGPSSACGVFWISSCLDQICELTWFWSPSYFITNLTLAGNISLNPSKHVDTFMGSGYLNPKYLEEWVRSKVLTYTQQVPTLQIKRKCSNVLWRPSRILHKHLKVYSRWPLLPLQLNRRFHVMVYTFSQKSRACVIKQLFLTGWWNNWHI